MASPAIKRIALEYQSPDGKSPFGRWLSQLKDARAQAKITKAIKQMEAGNFGDHKAITDGKGLQERRIHYGPGYRLYYFIDGDQLIVLFAGSTKADQNAIIKNAQQYLTDYLVRKA
ncbi:type II toxin-antitoxin system RelE/ParE family toxin [Saccharospirillum mangrovi]|uniref:type II toxin-antitoxin system RelE/ParE family toxin n=1 Tax=Saccharospirillum mangrovi TaxID=2161747 RepID=UPI000D389D75|nr:type II toxin-antitoxin system RelE/ParE family toxin [Saccharospirillum mangrovi]